MKSLLSRLLKVTIFALFLLLWGQHFSFAQGLSTESRGIDRWSFGTNAIDWLFTVPNIRVSYDLSSSRYNHLVGMMGVRYNWDTWQNADPYYVLNLFEVRSEVRRYFRTTTVDQKKHPGGKVPWYSNQKQNPRPWRAYYVGAFAGYTLYSMKPGAIGRQGEAVGLGLSAGYEIPLYTYKKGAVDLDLGVSAGLIYHSDQAYVLSYESAFFRAAPEEKQVFPILPVLTELRAAFSWRHKPIDRKYLEENPMDDRYRDEKKVIDLDYPGYTVDAFWESRTPQQKAQLSRSDSLYRASYIQYVDEWEEGRAGVIANDSFFDQPTQKRLRQYLHHRANSLRHSFNKKASELKKERKKAEKELKAAQKAKEQEAKEQEQKPVIEEKPAKKVKVLELIKKMKKDKAKDKDEEKEEEGQE